MAIRLIREKDVASLVTIEDALDSVEQAFLEQARGSGVNDPRRRVRQPHGTLHLMGAAMGKRGYWGFKSYTTTRTGARFIVTLYQIQTGVPLAMIEANLLGQLRTGAASGIAVKYLATSDADVLALIGTGYQAETQIAAIAAVRSLKAVRVYSRSPDRREVFAERMQRWLGLDVIPVQTPAEAVVGARIITTITTSSSPVFNGDDLAPGVHINAAGSNSSVRAEVDRSTIRRADRIFTDDLSQARIESGSLIQCSESNDLSWGRVRLLCDVVAGLTSGRLDDKEITLFASHGIALWDVALSAVIYERAIERDVGEDIAFGD